MSRTSNISAGSTDGWMAGHHRPIMRFRIGYGSCTTGAPAYCDTRWRSVRCSPRQARRQGHTAQTIFGMDDGTGAYQEVSPGSGGADGSALFFIASDELNPDFWQPLVEHYRLIRCVDFLKPAALVSECGGLFPDNYLLYQVEWEAARSAWMRTGTFPRSNDSDMHGSLVGEEDYSPVVARPTWAGRVTAFWRSRRTRLMASAL